MDVASVPIVALARSPGHGTPIVLARGRFVTALLFVFAATLVSALVAVRIATETNVDELFLSETRHPGVTAMLEAFGPERTAVVLYLVQRSFDAVVVATALTPVFIWLLGSSAVHAAARVLGFRRPFLPILTFFGYASALTLIPPSATALAVGVGGGIGSQLAGLVNLACLVWLAVLAYRGVIAHYGTSGEHAVRILVVALVLFYLIPVVLIVGSAVAIVVAALVLGYF